mmetsp:Transcript_11829/g.42291  ORF Transcript_11829/g.42291 Transcript_11829/m.42291 type:complete len:207 (-) Transcript_11829:30-650(-)
MPGLLHKLTRRDVVNLGAAERDALAHEQVLPELVVDTPPRAGFAGPWRRARDLAVLALGDGVLVLLGPGPGVPTCLRGLLRANAWAVHGGDPSAGGNVAPWAGGRGLLWEGTVADVHDSDVIELLGNGLLRLLHRSFDKQHLKDAIGARRRRVVQSVDCVAFEVLIVLIVVAVEAHLRAGVAVVVGHCCCSPWLCEARGDGAVGGR